LPVQEEEDGCGIFTQTSLEYAFFSVLLGTIFGKEPTPLILQMHDGSQPPGDPRWVMPNIVSIRCQHIELSTKRYGFPEESLATVGPGGMKGIDAKLEIPEQMSEAELMSAVSHDHEVGSQPVTHPRGSREERAQESFDDFVPPGSIDMEEGGQGIAEHPELRPLPCNACARFITLNRRAASHLLLDLLVARRDMIRHSPDERAKRSLTQRKMAEILQVLC